MTARHPFLSSFALQKSNYYEQNYIFFGQSVFGQLISLIDPRIISEAGKACDSDQYVKNFKTKGVLAENQKMGSAKEALKYILLLMLIRQFIKWFGLLIRQKVTMSC